MNSDQHFLLKLIKLNFANLPENEGRKKIDVFFPKSKILKISHYIEILDAECFELNPHMQAWNALKKVKNCLIQNRMRLGVKKRIYLHWKTMQKGKTFCFILSTCKSQIFAEIVIRKRVVLSFPRLSQKRLKISAVDIFC